MTHITDFIVTGVDRYELGVLPRRHARTQVFKQGSAHPGLSEEERRICIAPAF